MSAFAWPRGRIAEIKLVRQAALLGFVLALAGAIALLPLTYAGMLVVGAGATVLLLIRPEFGPWLLAFSVPYGSLGEGASGGVNLSLTEPLVVVIVVSWLAKGIRERRIVVSPAPLYIPLLLFLGLVTFSLTIAPSLALGAKELVKWAALLAAYVFVVNVIKSRREMAILLSLIFAAAISESLLGFYQFVAKAGPESYAIGPFLRAFGTFGQPNPYAGYLTTAALTAFGAVLFSLKALFAKPGGLQTGPRWLVFMGWATFIACAAAIAMSFSRGAWLGLAVGIVVVTAMSSRRALWIMLVALTILAIVLSLGLAQMLPAQITGRIAEAASYFGVFDVREVKLTPQNWPLVERMAAWQAAWYMYEDNPLLGVGIGNYVEAYKDYYLPGWEEPKGHAHNFYLNVLAEMGIVGLASYLLLLACFFVHAFRVLRRLSHASEAQFERYMAIGFLGSLIALSVHNLFDNLYVHGIGVQIGLILGLVTVLDRIGRGYTLGAEGGT